MQLENFTAFIRTFSQKHQIAPVLVFFGKRNKLSASESANLQQIGLLLQDACPEIIFRAGNQTGADKDFIRRINPARLQIVPPYTGHRQNHIPPGASVFPLDQIQLPKTAIYYFKSVRPALYTQWQNKEKNTGYANSLYLLRNLAMVYGFKKDGIKYPQASFGLYYDDLAHPNSGGTGFTKAACTFKGISALNQTHWLNWLQQPV